MKLIKLIKQIAESPKDVNLVEVFFADIFSSALFFAIKLAAFVIVCKIFLG